MVMDSKTYRCRDCGYVLKTEEPINTCPQCGSLYLIPKELWEVHELKKTRLTFFHRLMLLVMGSILSLTTLFMVYVYTVARFGPNFALNYMVAVKLAITISLFIGLVGFFMGDDKMINMLSIIWGTSGNPFGEEVDGELSEIVNFIPPYIIYTILGGSIVVIYGYLAVEIIYS